MLRCVTFWRLGESQTFYKKSVNVCVPDLNILPWNIKFSHNRTWTFVFSFHNQGVCGWNCYLECEVLLCAVCSASPCLTRSVCSDSFFVGGRLSVHQCWSMIHLLTCTLLSYLKLNGENGWIYFNRHKMWEYMLWICMGKWHIVEYYIHCIICTLEAL
jgi:hypothetical protein